ncbi:hypothetical protein [Hahella ganghwensis]|uniref:hypothetical protein n=1 Tax=Hahella ganghwensis TaxID=286420 RepID=UPI0003618440|nr:hypothetical protein [Hahella ganghwensis]
MELPATGPTTLEVYQQHIGQRPSGVKDQLPNKRDGENKTDEEAESNPGKVEKIVADRERTNLPLQRTALQKATDYRLYTSATDAGVLRTKYAKLPNPEFVFYVYPHLTRVGGLPIPMYATQWPLFEKTHYALPGELVPDRSVEKKESFVTN